MQSCELRAVQRKTNFQLLSKLSRNCDETAQLNPAASHVRGCEVCAREYLKQVLAGKLWQIAVPIAGQTAGGPSQPPTGSLAELEEALLSQATQAHNANKHGVLALVHALDE